jgi:hypothetical protein
MGLNFSKLKFMSCYGAPSFMLPREHVGFYCYPSWPALAITRTRLGSDSAANNWDYSDIRQAGQGQCSGGAVRAEIIASTRLYMG